MSNQMAKKGIHPDYHAIVLVLPGGKEIKTKSTFGSADDRMILEVDLTTHPAWKVEGGSFINEGSSVVAKFRKKYGSVNLTELMKGGEA